MRARVGPSERAARRTTGLGRRARRQGSRGRARSPLARSRGFGPSLGINGWACTGSPVRGNYLAAELRPHHRGVHLRGTFVNAAQASFRPPGATRETSDRRVAGRHEGVSRMQQTAPGRAHVRNVRATSGPPPGPHRLRADALEHRGVTARHLRQQDDMSSPARRRICLDNLRRPCRIRLLAAIFPHARHSPFRLVHLASAPAMGNVRLVTLKGRCVSCGMFPGWGALAHEGSRTRRWLVVVHGWAMTPFMCLGQ